MDEQWKAIEDFEGLYEISNYGNVKSLDRIVTVHGGGKRFDKERILKPHRQKNGHMLIVLHKNGTKYPRLVHRLVASAFIPNPLNKPVVDHIDTNPANNSVENLRWATVQENCMNPLTRIHNSESKKGHRGYLKCHSEETKKRLSEMNKSKTLSDETKRKISIAHMGVSHPNKMKGRHWKLEGGKRVWY